MGLLMVTNTKSHRYTDARIECAVLGPGESTDAIHVGFVLAGGHHPLGRCGRLSSSQSIHRPTEA